MRLRPMPVVMVSAYTEAGSETTLRALELGPSISSANRGRQRPEHGSLRRAGRKAAGRQGAHLYKLAPVVPPAVRWLGRVKAVGDQPRRRYQQDHLCRGIDRRYRGHQVRAFSLPRTGRLPPILIVQHMPEILHGVVSPAGSTSVGALVNRGHRRRKGRTRNGLYRPGTPTCASAGTRLRHRTLATPPVNRHRPSVDVSSTRPPKWSGVAARPPSSPAWVGTAPRACCGCARPGLDVRARTRRLRRSWHAAGGFLIGAVEEQCSLDDMARQGTRRGQPLTAGAETNVRAKMSIKLFNNPTTPRDSACKPQ